MKKNILILTVLFFNVLVSLLYSIEITQITCNLKENPIGIVENPRFGWIMTAPGRNESQTAYHILVSDDLTQLEKEAGNCWDTKKVISEQSINVFYQGIQLAPAKKYYWKVKVWDAKGKGANWSNVASFTTGLFSEKDWSGARWIGYEEIDFSTRLVPGVHTWQHDLDIYTLKRPVIPYFRKEFSVQKEVKSAFLYISGLGQYEASLNGIKISDDFLAPGWTNYDKECLYNTYEITSQLNNGTNALGVIVGNGFYNINKDRYKKFVIAYGMPKFISALKINYVDGTNETIISNEEWKTFPSPVTFTSIYGGEDYDAGKEPGRWDQPGYYDKNWKNVVIVGKPKGKLSSETGYPVRVMEVFEPVKIQKLSRNVQMYDFGQNTSGIIEIKVKGKPGDKIRFRPGELLNEQGYINQRASGRPYYFEYILKGDSVETWRPRFSYYGFRYVEAEIVLIDSNAVISEYPDILEINLLHTRNSSPFAGSFSCSNELFNNTFRLIDYAIKSNFQSVFTDCPHREKLGWLEQTYLMGGGIHYNYEVYHQFRKTLRDMQDAQTPEGLIPNIAPEFVLFEEGFYESPEWGSAGIILPWLLYQWYGDTSIIREAWPMMNKYISYLESKSDSDILSYGLSDWFDHGPERPGFAQLTPMGLTATAIYYYDMSLMGEMAALLGRTNEKDEFQKKAEQIKTSFNRKFFNPQTKVYATGSQTAMAMPLCLGIVEEEYKKDVLAILIDSINSKNKALTAGDIGFHFLVQALTDAGKSQLIYEMNNRDDVPGYGYQIRKGATALTESWDALPIVSNNHLMLGHIMQWFYEGLGGINQEENSVAYKNILIKPKFVGDITHVKAKYKCPYGNIVCEWDRTDKNVTLNVEIPVNTTASVYLPSDVKTIFENNKSLSKAKGITEVFSQDNNTVIETGSGKYSYTFIINE